MKRVFVTGPALAGVTATVARISELTGRSITNDVIELELAGMAVMLRRALRWARVYDPFDGSDPRVREQARFLSELDVLVFVADSQPERQQANLECLENTRDLLLRLGRDPDPLEIVFQLNKRDLENRMTEDEMRSTLEWPRCSYVTTSASTGAGIEKLLATIATTGFDATMQTR